MLSPCSAKFSSATRASLSVVPSSLATRCRVCEETSLIPLRSGSFGSQRRALQAPPAADSLRLADCGLGLGASGVSFGSRVDVELVARPAGSRKPDTDLRSCADSSASLPMEFEVALVESAVCELISRSTCMLRAMAPAAEACPRELAEMFCTRLAIWFDDRKSTRLNSS